MNAIAHLYAKKIMLKNRTFESIPKALKPQVAEILVESGFLELVTDPTYLPKEN